MTSYKTGALAAALGTIALLTALPQTGVAQQMGRDGYNPSTSRNRSIATQLEMQNNLNQQSSGSGASALEQYVTTYYSSSTAIANMNSVTQNVGSGSTATVGQTTDQQSTGNQDSAASTDVTQVSNVSVSEALIEALGDTGASEGEQTE